MGGQAGEVRQDDQEHEEDDQVKKPTMESGFARAACIEHIR